VPGTPPAPANKDRKPAIVTARRPRVRSSVDVPDMDAGGVPAARRGDHPLPLQPGNSELHAVRVAGVQHQAADIRKPG
jgi:hypothetical protein